ncbi:MAG: ferrous iron transport protein [Candidatus Sumerlaeota bacterium]|nr:ferrous iron transport protein [Candidatus Sumerlaeota bacterium]
MTESQPIPSPEDALAPSPPSAVRRVALLGNPNTGKTTLFNALTGHRARVGNYSGVTVEKREGALKGAERPVTLVDLPGTYSLSAHSADEFVAVEVLLGLRADSPRPDALVVVADASNLERNLFLATQVLELGLPTFLALNMTDVAEQDGVAIDATKLAAALGVPVIETNARAREGVDKLKRLLEREDLPDRPRVPRVYPDEFLKARDALREELAPRLPADFGLDAFAASRLLLEIDGEFEARAVAQGGSDARAAIERTRTELESAGLRVRSLEARSRYQWIREHTNSCFTETQGHGRSSHDMTERVDRILTHRIYGTGIFLLLMALVFQAIYSWSGPLMDLIDSAFGALGMWVGGLMPPGPLQSLLVDGVIAGVGGVVIFIPQILILFAFIALLEDVGYMARAAFLMDRLLSRAGLSGRSFIPMLSSFACAVPGLMATRTIENQRDRLATILVSPLMSCSARLPVYTIMIAAFVPDHRMLGIFNLPGLVLLAMYLVGIAVAIPVTWILKKTILKSKTPSFLIELPPYRKPLAANVLSRMIERGREFLVRAGTIILAVSIVVWALSYFPRPDAVANEYEIAVESINAQYLHAFSQAGISTAGGGIPTNSEETAQWEAYYADLALDDAVDFEEWGRQLDRAAVHRDGEYLRNSYLGRMGKLLEPAVRPLGWDWRIGMAALASFPAREVIIAILGVIFDLGPEGLDDQQGMIEKLRAAEWPDGRPLFDLPVALGIMVFFALCMQCAATLATMKRETNSWRWPVFAFVYMTVLAYLGAMITYQVSSLLL